MTNVTTPQMSIGWVGLGSMGFGMATNLVKRGHQVTAYDISTAAQAKFAAVGGTAANSLRESAVGKMLYVCMVASAAQLEELMFAGVEPLINFLEFNVTFLVTSTVAEDDIKLLQQRLNDRRRGDILLVDCPVSGGARRAAEGTLSIMAAGSTIALQKAQLLLTEMADPDKLFFPGELGQGSNMKMVHQVLADINIVATSEALAFASWLGLDLEEVRQEVLKPGSKAYSWMFENRSPRTIVDWPAPVESAINLVVKDLGIIVKMARKKNARVPLSSTAEHIAILASLQGFGSEDDATLARIYCPKFEQPRRTPLTPIQDPTQKKKAMDMVRDLLIVIHTLAVAEAVDLAVNIDLDSSQVMKLVQMSAGASAAFTQHAGDMFQKREEGYMDDQDNYSVNEHPDGEDDGYPNFHKKPLEALSIPIGEVVAKAQSIGCPLFLGNAALERIHAREQSQSDPTENLWIYDLVG